MGRYYGIGKDTVEDYPRTLTIKGLKNFLKNNKEIQSGSYNWTSNGKETGNMGVEMYKGKTSGYIRVQFTQTNYNGEKNKLDYKIQLVSTPCNYGGVRWWFLCPCKGNRCGVLYLQSNGIFASRKTLDLCYENQKKSKKWRLIGYLMYFNFTRIEIIRRTIKYPYRNGKPTRKMRRILKLRESRPSIEEVNNMSKILGLSK